MAKSFGLIGAMGADRGLTVGLAIGGFLAVGSGPIPGDGLESGLGAATVGSAPRFSCTPSSAASSGPNMSCTEPLDFFSSAMDPLEQSRKRRLAHPYPSNLLGRPRF